MSRRGHSRTQTATGHRRRRTWAAISWLAVLLVSTSRLSAQNAGAAGPNAAIRPAGSPKPSEAADYRLAAGDKLRIEVYKDAQLSQSLQIRPDGKITLPLIGDIPAAGSTPRELAGTLTERLREYVTTPVVTVIVAEAMPPMVYVMGEVNSPGAKPMHEPTTVLQVLALAGGFKDFANPKKIKILRKGPNGALQTINFNYKDAVERPDRPMFLQPGDTIIVP
jgi:polysaccharide export outer membrane protein